MYAVVRYFNFRKDVSFAVLKTFNDLTRADHYAKECAREDYDDDELVTGVSEEWVYVDNVVPGYTQGDGYDQFVYTVIELPEPDDKQTETKKVVMENETEIEKQSNQNENNEKNMEKETVTEMLTENVLKDFNNVLKYHSRDSKEERMLRFKTTYEDFTGTAIDEFNQMPNVVYKEWDYWKMVKGYIPELGKPFSEVWNEFKAYWQYDNEETKVVFKEMELMSNNMLTEWRMKYTDQYPHVYEDDYWNTTRNARNRKAKSKAEMWEEFKEKWGMDVENYNEHTFNQMNAYINDTLCDTDDYCREYPRNIYEYRENANYHSFDSYSIWEQYQICQQWEEHKENCSNYISDSESDTDLDSY
jgi:hypothetical protein